MSVIHVQVYTVIQPRPHIFFCSYLISSSLASEPVTLHILAQPSCTSNGQITLPQLLLNDLPSTDGDLSVNGSNPLAVHLDVGQRGEVGPGLEDLGQLLAALGIVDGQGEEVVRGAGGAELDVRDEAAGELVETLSDL